MYKNTHTRICMNTGMCLCSCILHYIKTKEVVLTDLQEFAIKKTVRKETKLEATFKYPLNL